MSHPACGRLPVSLAEEEGTWGSFMVDSSIILVWCKYEQRIVGQLWRKTLVGCERENAPPTEFGGIALSLSPFKPVQSSIIPCGPLVVPCSPLQCGRIGLLSVLPSRKGDTARLTQKEQTSPEKATPAFIVLRRVDCSILTTYAPTLPISLPYLLSFLSPHDPPSSFFHLWTTTSSAPLGPSQVTRSPSHGLLPDSRNFLASSASVIPAAANMERVRKTFFDPLATSKDRIRGILESLPVGSTHPFSPEGILLCKTENGIEEIDISACEESYFYNAVDLGEMGEVLLRRMSGFKDKLGTSRPLLMERANTNRLLAEVFKDFHIQQAPALTFKIPIKSNRISIFAVSERIPTYYDFCIANAESSSCCYSAVDTFKGITHSGDVCTRNDLLQYVKINETSLDETEYCVFISGFQSTKITRFLGTNPALLVANYEDKVTITCPMLSLNVS